MDLDRRRDRLADRRARPNKPRAAWPLISRLVHIAIMTAAFGLLFSGTPRLALGGNCSASVTVKQDHRLIRQGPCAIVRHPIYSGGLLGLLGTALALAFIGWRMKSRRRHGQTTE